MRAIGFICAGLGALCILLGALIALMGFATVFVPSQAWMLPPVGAVILVPLGVGLAMLADRLVP